MDEAYHSLTEQSQEAFDGSFEVGGGDSVEGNSRGGSESVGDELGVNVVETGGRNHGGGGI